MEKTLATAKDMTSKELAAQPMKYFASLQVATIQQAILTNSRPLAQIRKDIGETVTAAVLVKILQGLITFFNVGKSMNDTQLAETVKLIMTEYYFLKLEDFKLCFDGMKAGKYIEGGKLFDRLDGQIILLALKAYTEERIEIAEILSNEKHKELQQPDDEKYLVMVGENYIREVGDSFEEVDKKDIATVYDFGKAINRKNYIIKAYGEKAKVVYSTKSEIGLIDHIKKVKPELAKELEVKEVKKRQRDRFSFMVADIENNDALTPLQKRNKIRGLYGLYELTEKEFELSESVVNKKK